MVKYNIYTLFLHIISLRNARSFSHWCSILTKILRKINLKILYLTPEERTCDIIMYARSIPFLYLNSLTFPIFDICMRARPWQSLHTSSSRPNKAGARSPLNCRRHCSNIPIINDEALTFPEIAGVKAHTGSNIILPDMPISLSLSFSTIWEMMGA